MFTVFTVFFLKKNHNWPKQKKVRDAYKIQTILYQNTTNSHDCNLTEILKLESKTGASPAYVHTGHYKNNTAYKEELGQC